MGHVRMAADARDEAVELLQHYFRVAGVPDHRDVRDEIAAIVDLIIEAAKEAMDQPGRG